MEEENTNEKAKDNEETKEEVKEEEEQKTTGNNGDGNIKEKTSIIERANEVSKKLEQQIEELKELTLRNEEVMAQNILSGKSEAGQKFEKKEESPKEYADRVMQGKI